MRKKQTRVAVKGFRHNYQVQTTSASTSAKDQNVTDVTQARDQISVINVSSDTRSTNNGWSRFKKKITKAENEKRIFVTLSYIVFSYLICWVPFHVVFDISALDPMMVPESVYTFTFWLTYFSSTLNPFLYAFRSVEFKRAFKRVAMCRF